jgi:HNH endonuclease
VERVATHPEPYSYPSRPHQRRHGPAGYSSYESYRPWLEDEFHFRCIYCLKRMAWAPTDVWAVDHLIPQQEAADRACDYNNLVLACQCCNSQKSSHRVPDPCQVAYGLCLRVESSGQLTPLNAKGKRLVDTIRLNHEKYVNERAKMIKLLEMAKKYDEAQFEVLMGFPSRLPDLAKLKPPGGNGRLDGVSDSFFARQIRGVLPKTY